MSIVSDFDDIGRRMNRKPEATPGIVPLATPFAVSIGLTPREETPASVKTLQAATKPFESPRTYHADAARILMAWRE